MKRRAERWATWLAQQDSDTVVVLVEAWRTAGAFRRPSLVRHLMDSTLLIILLVLLVLGGGGWGYSRRRR